MEGAVHTGTTEADVGAAAAEGAAEAVADRTVPNTRFGSTISLPVAGIPLLPIIRNRINKTETYRYNR